MEAKQKLQVLNWLYFYLHISIRIFCILFIMFAWKAKRFAFASFLHLLLIQGFSRKLKNSEQKKNFTDHQTADTIQIFVAIKGNFSGLIFFWTSCREGKFPKDYLINEATCLFTYHWVKTFSTGQKPVWSVMAVPEHGTIIRKGITCKKISFYMRDLACMWLIVENAKIFLSYVKHF